MSQDSHRHDPSRRAFLTSAAVAASAAAIGLRPRSASAAGASLPHLTDKNDPLAKSLGYRADAKDVNKAKFSTYKAGDHCSVCRFFKGTPGEKSGYAGCQLYSGYSVNAQGWCASFSARS